MVNTLGLSRADVLSALGAAAGCRWEPVRPYKFAWNPVPNCFCTIINGALVILDLRADDGFDEGDFDHALGLGTAQRAVDRLRTEKGGGGHEETDRL